MLDLAKAQAYNANLNSLLHEYKNAHQNACQNLVNVSTLGESSTIEADPNVIQLSHYIMQLEAEKQMLLSERDALHNRIKDLLEPS